MGLISETKISFHKKSIEKNLYLYVYYICEALQTLFISNLCEKSYQKIVPTFSQIPLNSTATSIPEFPTPITRAFFP